MQKQKRFFSCLVAVMMILAISISSCNTTAPEEAVEDTSNTSEAAVTGTQPGNYENATREETVYF